MYSESKKQQWRNAVLQKKQEMNEIMFIRNGGEGDIPKEDIVLGVTGE